MFFMTDPIEEHFFGRPFVGSLSGPLNITLITTANPTQTASPIRAFHQPVFLPAGGITWREADWEKSSEVVNCGRKKSLKKSALCLYSKEMSESDVSECEHCDNWWWWRLPKELNSRWVPLLFADQWLTKTWWRRGTTNTSARRASAKTRRREQTVVITASTPPSPLLPLFLFSSFSK